MFLLLLIITLIISIAFPGPGSFLYQQGYIVPAFIAFMYFSLGSSENYSSIKNSLKKIKTTIIIQITIFIIAPLIALLLFIIISKFYKSTNLIGLLFIGSVPTTMTSCIFLTSKYEGDDILALCNSMLAQIIGVIITPIILLFVLSTNSSQATSFSIVFKKLLLQVLTPFIIGQILNKYLYDTKLTRVSKKVISNGIFPLIYLSIAQVVAMGDFKSIIIDGLPLIGICIIFGILQLLATQIMANVFNFNHKEKIAMLFVGSNKTMGLGIPLVLMYYPNSPQISTNIILMFLTYYIFSLIIVPFVADFLNKKAIKL